MIVQSFQAIILRLSAYRTYWKLSPALRMAKRGE